MCQKFFNCFSQFEKNCTVITRYIYLACIFSVSDSSGGLTLNRAQGAAHTAGLFSNN